MLEFSTAGVKQHPTWLVNSDSKETPGANYTSKHGVDPVTTAPSGTPAG
jgi:hypothetical protein